MEKKKPRQRGQVKVLGDGKYKIAVPLGTRPNGHRPYHNETLYNTTELKAWKRVSVVLAQVDAGTYFEPSDQLLSELLGEWIDRKRRDGVREITLENYKYIVSHYIPEKLGKCSLSELAFSDIQRFCNTLQDEDYNSSTIRQVLSVLRKAFAFAIKHGKLKANPAIDIDLPPRTKPRKARVFDEAEAARFIEAAREVHNDILFIFVLLTGMRPEEFIGLEWSQITLATDIGAGTLVERGLVRVTQTVVRRKGGGWYFSEPKTEQSTRPIYFPASLYYELAARRDEHLERLRKLGRKHQLVFTNSVGEPLDRCNLSSRRFKRLLKRAGLEKEGYSLYTLRRSHATLSLLAGEDMSVVSERMGHASVEFTRDEYVDVLPEMQQKASDRLENFLLGRQVAHPGWDMPM